MFKRILVFLVVMACIVGVGRTAFGQFASAADTNSDYTVGAPEANPIPQEALRLRIIANSDSDSDQELKREVRDAVVTACAKWLQNAKTPEQARAIVTSHIPQFQAIAKQIIAEKGYHYAVNTVVGQVPFPTKIYGNRVYPAGNYDALRIIIGKGAGQNWWCVLFPPLCFVDIADGDAVPNTGGFPDLPPLETINVETSSGQSEQVAVRLASVDYGEELWKSVHQWFQ